MKTIKSLLTLFAVPLLFGCNTTSPHHAGTGFPLAVITVTVSCSDLRMKFAGTIVSDGHLQKLSGTGSATYQASGHEIVCSFKKLDAEGRITLSVSDPEKKLGDSSTPSRFGGVRAEFLRTSIMQHDVFPTFQ